ncbi:hypothetical protein HBI56_107490 [Parastagonospora nodorum]|uniref:Uncharacterized protein n=1 Tax=Phaeosphaeria nodorum (strain SN15 / ATCC MYA-4574 / FGSC 10173) TaxID=321614 RepID=A0A7U2I5Y3_PHANO|nr:hypothetical protein HBH56_131390 [Parastagonospora nodorum]QRD02899.1 hypothetical protein JI435_116230 [Parastagonospora nodorum SN15]KAH3938099.1 hypothetical protein HBH54_007300 [Parastagonospora nodorum]KAH3949518.1 hypothetical protein HBH53_086350 [Parastagonospora nodorum]KAH3974778.1 hypothetical protein HBH52_135220 [Parastagonospora nodorum]
MPLRSWCWRGRSWVECGMTTAECSAGGRPRGGFASPVFSLASPAQWCRGRFNSN